MHGVVQAIYALAHAEVEHYAGTLQEVMGESFLVFFGAPLAQEDHALRAVLMALGLQRRLHESGAVPTLPTGESVALRMALHTGLVVVGARRRGLHETAVVGDVITLAAALARRPPLTPLLAVLRPFGWCRDKLRQLRSPRCAWLNTRRRWRGPR